MIEPGVTDNKNAHGVIFDSRNEQGLLVSVTDIEKDTGSCSISVTALDKAEAFFEAYDPRTSSEKDEWRKQLASMKAAVVCFECGRAIDPAETIYQRRVTRMVFFGCGTTLAVYLQQTAERSGAGGIFSIRHAHVKIAVEQSENNPYLLLQPARINAALRFTPSAQRNRAE